MKNNLFNRAILVATISLMGACSASGKNMNYEVALEGPGGDAVELGKTLDAASELETKGNKEIAKGQKLIRDGEEKIANGEGYIATGNAEIIAQKANYTRFVRAMGLASTPKQMEKEIKSLRMVAETWDNGLDAVERGEKLIEEGEKNIAEGRAKIRKGGGFVTQGQEQKKAVEKRVQSVEPMTNVEIEDSELEGIY